MAPKGPYKLCTVNKVPTRAKVLIGRLVEAQKEDYTIDYVSNAESKFFNPPFQIQRTDKNPLEIEDVKTMVEEYKPDVLVSSSMCGIEKMTDRKSSS